MTKNYYLTWSIEIEATSPKVAAEMALEIQRDPESIATVFMVSDENGAVVQIDAAKRAKSVEEIIDELVDDAADTCRNDTGYLYHILRSYFDTFDVADLREMHANAFEHKED